MFSFAGIFFTFFPFPEKKKEKKKDKASFAIEIITSRDKRKDLGSLTGKSSFTTYDSTNLI